MSSLRQRQPKEGKEAEDYYARKAEQALKLHLKLAKVEVLPSAVPLGSKNALGPGADR